MTYRSLSGLLAVFLALPFLGACSLMPDCSAKDVEALVVDIVKRQLLAIHLPQIVVDRMDLELRDIRTNTELTQMRKCVCAAKLTNKAHPRSKSVDIAYTAQFTDDNRLYVEVANPLAGQHLIPTPEDLES